MSNGPLQVNARLTAVTTATAAVGQRRDDWDTAEGVEPAGAGTSKWSGDEPCYYRETIDDSTGDVLVKRTLWLQTRTARSTGMDSDDVITFVTADGTQHSATAVAIAYADAASRYLSSEELGAAFTFTSRIETTRVELAPA